MERHEKHRTKVGDNYKKYMKNAGERQEQCKTNAGQNMKLEEKA